MQNEVYKTYIHAPAHLFRSGATYFITAAIYQKKHFIASSTRKSFWFETLTAVLNHYRWTLTAWVVLNNHYHLLCVAPKESATDLPKWITTLHRRTSKQWNIEDRSPGRQMWWNYWDTCITSERSYYTRLNYIHFNPVKHGIVTQTEDYPFSSHTGYLRAQPEAIRRIIANYPFDRVKVKDDF